LATSLTSPSQDKNQSVIKQKPLALIYDGQGSCKPAEGESFTSCAEAAKQVAEKAGFIVKYATDTSLNAFSTEADYQKLFKGWRTEGDVKAAALKINTPDFKLEDELLLKVYFECQLKKEYSL
jgi:hypothetical protein